MRNCEKLICLLMFFSILFFEGCLAQQGRAELNSNQKFVFGNLVKVTNLSNENNSSAENKEESKTGDFKSAAQQNSELQKSLKWIFGKKNQLGWYLYVPLIQHTVGTEENSDSEKFAEAVAAWQKKNKLTPTGVIDEKTFAEIFKYWQSRRLKSLKEADENTLFTAPATDFYDPSRDILLRKVERETYTAYKKLVAAAAKDLNLKNKNGELAENERFLKIISSYRSPEYQKTLRSKDPNAGRAQLALVSPHFTGRALDIYVGGEPVTTKDENRAIQIETPVYKWLVKNAERFGFYPYFYEPWHWEYVQ